MSDMANLNRTVWKYEMIAGWGAPTVMGGIDIVAYAPKIVAVGLDPNRAPCVWVEQIDPTGVDPSQRTVLGPETTFNVSIIGTGHRVPDQMLFRHVGMLVSGPLVLHAYSNLRP